MLYFQSDLPLGANPERTAISLALGEMQPFRLAVIRKTATYHLRPAFQNFAHGEAAFTERPAGYPLGGSSDGAQSVSSVRDVIAFFTHGDYVSHCSPAPVRQLASFV